MKDNTRGKRLPDLIDAVVKILQAHRGAFQQERPYRRAIGLIFSELFNFGRHTLAQGMLTLGLTEGDWSAWYRLFSHTRYDEEELAGCMLKETIQEVPVEEPYCVAIDSTSVHRSSMKMPGTSWLRDSRFSTFRPGVHRAQRFLHGAWLTPLEAGYSRAIPLRFLPAFPPKAVPAQVPARREWEAGLLFLNWLRDELNQLGRSNQPVLALADGSFDVLDLWRGLPEGVVLMARTARNRRLFWLPAPDPHPGPGRPPSYGALAPHPADWLHAGLRNWPKQIVLVRGRCIEMRYQVLGPFVREELPEKPLFLIVTKGIHRRVGVKKPHFQHREPSFFLVSAVQRDSQWSLPFPIEVILPWLWQRWEIEVAHRELKTGLGLGEKQCWNVRSAFVSVQWSAWVYAVLLLAAYRTWGLCHGPRPPSPWWPGAKRWSLSTLFRAFRSALWGLDEFRTLCIPSVANWWNIETWLGSLSNSALSSSRI